MRRSETATVWGTGGEEWKMNDESERNRIVNGTRIVKRIQNEAREERAERPI